MTSKISIEIELADITDDKNLVIDKDIAANIYFPEYGIYTTGEMILGQGCQIT
ncbi:MAG: hypothetical protein KGZ71_00345 [Desulfobulbaceae bacterium]|nr:hypothetical protein [Candidatus Kapabacteria bacterium]MBS3998909.1 hypothetical protein [Desulfobulbaceae bacterium]